MNVVRADGTNTQGENINNTTICNCTPGYNPQKENERENINININIDNYDDYQNFAAAEKIFPIVIPTLDGDMNVTEAWLQKVKDEYFSGIPFVRLEKVFRDFADDIARGTRKRRTQEQTNKDLEMALEDEQTLAEKERSTAHPIPE